MIKVNPPIEEFKILSKKGNLIPVWLEISSDNQTPVSIYQKINENSDNNSFLLESIKKSKSIGRYSFIGNKYLYEIYSFGENILIKKQGENDLNFKLKEKDPLSEVEKIMSKYKPVKIKSLPSFSGGAVGFLGYDTISFFEPSVGKTLKEGIKLPDMAFIIADTIIAFDHKFRKIQIISNVYKYDYEKIEEGYKKAKEKISEILEKLSLNTIKMPLFIIKESKEDVIEDKIKSNTTKDEYENMVKKSKEYIKKGDIFQVVPSQRFSIKYDKGVINLYRSLRHLNPSPYMFCFKFGNDFSLVGSSPETHVKIIGKNINIRPIAGTRKRGANNKEDKKLSKELLSDKKEIAEHVMLVDLARNDIGRVSKYKSIKLNEFMIVEKYSHVMHIVSNIKGKLQKGKNSYDVLRATFPAGTVSGSPKVRAMQIIKELEKSKRGAYSGAIGYFGFNGNHDSCIALRTAVLKDNKAYVQTGAGVVADSIPENEYEETLNKAKGIIKAIEQANKII